MRIYEEIVSNQKTIHTAMCNAQYIAMFFVILWHRRENQKVAQCRSGSVNGQVHCFADIYCVFVLLCMSDLHHVHCTCSSPHK